MRATWVVLLAVMAAGCYPTRYVRGPYPDDVTEGVPIYLRPDSSTIVTNLPYFFDVGMQGTRGDWVKLEHMGTYGLDGFRWIHQSALFNTEELAREDARRKWIEHSERIVSARRESFIAAHGELSDEQAEMIRAGELAVGMPGDAAIAVHGDPDGMEDIATSDGTTTRLTWLPATSSTAKVASGGWSVPAERVRLVVTVEGGKITRIRRGVGAAEDAER
jgi:hypothetical protein